MNSLFSPVKARGMGADPACKVVCNRGERRAPGARAGGPGRGWEAVNALNVSLWIRAWWQRCSPRHSRRHAQSNFCTCHGLRTKRFSSQACVCVSHCGNGRMSHRDRHRRGRGYLAPAPHLSASIPRGLKLSSLQSCAQGVQEKAAGPSDTLRTGSGTASRTYSLCSPCTVPFPALLTLRKLFGFCLFSE